MACAGASYHCLDQNQNQPQRAMRPTTGLTAKDRAVVIIAINNIP